MKFNKFSASLIIFLITTTSFAGTKVGTGGVSFIGNPILEISTHKVKKELYENNFNFINDNESDYPIVIRVWCNLEIRLHLS
jgi:hypothetical protein